MEAEQEIKSLIRECVAYFREEGYSEPRIADYQRLWRNGIKEYMSKHTARYTSDFFNQALAASTGPRHFGLY
jgi:hypothetical protein